MLYINDQLFTIYIYIFKANLIYLKLEKHTYAHTHTRNIFQIFHIIN